MQDYTTRALDAHKQYQGKIAVQSKVPVATTDDLSVWYSPWVAAPCLAIRDDVETAYEYTWKWNAVAVVSDGSAVLWLWNIWWVAWLPVMEWKAILMREFWWINAVPLVLATQQPDEIIKIVQAVAPTFGAINLEDIKAPECFYIEEALQASLPIPVFHDDQHGTAIVVLAWLYNALTVVWKNITDICVTITGAWAAWIATARLLHAAWVQNIRMVDSQWVIHTSRAGLNTYKELVAAYNRDNISWTLSDAMVWADVVIWVSQPWIITQEHIESMREHQIVFALSNPHPEITLEDARLWWAMVYASWRSDLPNQVNNLLVFPWLLRGVLDARIPQISMDHKLLCAQVLASIVATPTVWEILPSPLDKTVAPTLAQALVESVKNQ